MTTANLIPSVTTCVSIPYQDLVCLDPNDNGLIHKIEQAFGSNEDCLGIIAVTDLPPSFSTQRSSLLPLARKLATLSDLDECVKPDAFYSVGWSHGREQLAPGKPDLAKGSFYANPLTDDVLAARRKECDADEGGTIQLATAHPDLYAPNVWPEASLPSLRPAFMELGQNMVTMGHRIAAVCDAYCERNGLDNVNLCKTLRESLNVKGRLLHYFDIAKTQKSECDTNNNNDMWCGWHNDHGSLTGLVPAMYLDREGNPVDCPDDVAGLHIQSRSGQIFKVKLPSNSCAFQIGEAAQISSGGLLQATPHAVLAPKAAVAPGTTRETLAVFIEPEFHVPLEIPKGKSVNDCQVAGATLPPTVLPLRARWKPGYTFGDFHHATVKAFCVEDEKTPKDQS